jgi:hypothetical protein
VRIKSDSGLGVYKPDVVYANKFGRFLVVWGERVCEGEPIKCNYVIKERLSRLKRTSAKIMFTTDMFISIILAWAARCT